MNSQVISIIDLIKDNKTIYTINIKNLEEYDFYYDTSQSSTLTITTSTLTIDDLNMLIRCPCDAYVLMGKKVIIKDGTEHVFKIPAMTYKYMSINDNGIRTKITFKEVKTDEQSD